MKRTSKILILGLVMVMALCYANSASAEKGLRGCRNLQYLLMIYNFRISKKLRRRS